MIPALAVLAVAGVVVGFLLWRRQRTRFEPVRRDLPTTSAARPTGVGERLRTALGRAPRPGDWVALEEALIGADVGVATAAALVEGVRQERPADSTAMRASLRKQMIAALSDRDRKLRLAGRPAVIVVIGVNGSGKTTTIAKLASRLGGQGRKVLLGAADTFRAGAADQLRTWGERLGVEVVAGSPGADPASVAYDALAAARSRSCDVLIVDTAGRLHDKRNLMEELAKVVRVLNRDATGPPEVLLVLDGTTGQNGLAQARAFAAMTGVTGVVIAKLDGTSRGGIALAVERELGIAVKLVGVGEGDGDLRDFDPVWFVDSLLEGW